MTGNEIAMQRLANQQLLGTTFKTPKDIAAHLGAMQAQDYSMSKWAIGIRIAASERVVEQAIDNADIIRTHLLRPTWHLVSASDIRWMLALTAANVRKLYLPMSGKFGMDEGVLNGYNKVMAKALRNNSYLTREEIMGHLKLRGTFANDFRPSMIMMHAEQEAVVCNGPMRGKQFTYALMDERVPPSEELTRDEALARLAARYFSSHGPATVHDFNWWSGLSVADSKRAIELTKTKMQSVEVDKQVYWFYDIPKLNKTDSVHFLPAFDEFVISYKDRTACIPAAHQPMAFTRNGIFKPVIVVNGQVVGTWKRTVTKGNALIETAYFGKVTKSHLKDIPKYLSFYGEHIDKKIILI